MSNRTQAVKIGRHRSSFTDVLSGVPQGSILGPLLFLLFINDIVDIISNDLSIKLYADDVKIYSVINDVSSGVALQCALNNLCDWCVKWQMTINVNKCFVLALGRSSAISYTINNTLLPVSNVVSDLGVRVDTKLRFCYHYDNIVAKRIRELP